MSMFNSDQQAEMDYRAKLRRERDEHIVNHITDGQWHDGCPWCEQRRRFGGTGVPSAGEMWDAEHLRPKNTT